MATKCRIMIVFGMMFGFALASPFLAGKLSAAELTVDLGDAKGIAWVGAVDRWDQDGNHRKPPDPNAKIDAPYMDAKATNEGMGKWLFKDLKPGKYDLIILGEEKLRIEGFSYVPVKEFDALIKSDSKPEEDASEWILDDIRKSKHYENKVDPLYIAGNQKTCRILVMLVRDLPTSYTAGAGTMRHEIWQYSWNYGGWQKEKRTKVLDRVLMQVNELRQWTWLWDPQLGGIEVKSSPVTFSYQLPKKGDEKKLRGLVPSVVEKSP